MDVFRSFESFLPSAAAQPVPEGMQGMGVLAVLTFPWDPAPSAALVRGAVTRASSLQLPQLGCSQLLLMSGVLLRARVWGGRAQAGCVGGWTLAALVPTTGMCCYL